MEYISGLGFVFDWNAELTIEQDFEMAKKFRTIEWWVQRFSMLSSLCLISMSREARQEERSSSTAISDVYCTPEENKKPIGGETKQAVKGILEAYLLQAQSVPLKSSMATDCQAKNPDHFPPKRYPRDEPPPGAE
eukprot:TRINITY_DN461_c0_g1_i2.p1 TRINITY_DN461_c0_g1~~TRINITY_DN461_c0_g1_i2.p1  ORF type:complete len:135 (-),score=15.50 TRINITY_DN461_c0_g1_i2:350-754(-)